MGEIAKYGGMTFIQQQTMNNTLSRFSNILHTTLVWAPFGLNFQMCGCAVYHGIAHDQLFIILSKVEAELSKSCTSN